MERGWTEKEQRIADKRNSKMAEGGEEGDRQLRRAFLDVFVAVVAIEAVQHVAAPREARAFGRLGRRRTAAVRRLWWRSR